MTTRTGPAAPATAGSTEPAPVDPGAEARARRVVWWSTVLYLLSRAAVVLVADTPSVTPDELGAWAIAGYLVGDDVLISMRDMPRYSLMSGVAIAPVQALGLEPEAAYRLAIAWLAAFGVGAALLARRTVDLLRPGRPVLSAAVYGLVLLFPATLGTSFFTWAEPVVLLWWAVMAWSTVRGLALGDGRALLVGSVAAALAPAVHGRLIAAPAVWIAVCLCRAALGSHGGRDPQGPRRRATTARHALAAAGLVIVATLVVMAADDAVGAAVWEGARPAVDPVVDPASLAWWTDLVLSTVARLWYLIAATGGLALLGGVALLRGCRRGTGADRLAAATAVGLLGTNLAIGVYYLRNGIGDLERVRELGGLRWDHIVYGRYVDGAVLVLAAVGLVVAAGPRRRGPGPALWATAGVVAVCTVVVVRVVAGHQLISAIDVMIGGVSWIPSPWEQPATLAWWGLIATAVTAATAVATRRGAGAVLAVAAVWVLCGAALTTYAVADRHRDAAQPDLAASVGPPASQGATVAVAEDVEALPLWRLGIYAQQRDLSHLGWRFRFTGDPSTDLAADRTDAVALVLVDGVSPGAGWSRAAEFGDATVWRRDRD